MSVPETPRPPLMVEVPTLLRRLHAERLPPDEAEQIREELRPLREKLATPDGQTSVRKSLAETTKPAVEAERRHRARSKALAHTKVVR